MSELTWHSGLGLTVYSLKKKYIQLPQPLYDDKKKEKKLLSFSILRFQSFLLK